MKTKYTTGLALWEMAKQNEVDLGVLRAFGNRLGESVDTGTVEADTIEQKIYQQPLNKRQKKKNKHRIEALGILCRVLIATHDKQSKLAKLVDFYFQQYGEGLITQRRLFENLKIIREIEARVMQGEGMGEVIKSYGTESREELRKDKEFYDLALMRENINKAQHKEMMSVIKHINSEDLCQSNHFLS